MFLHCRNTKCKKYWEDSCTDSLENTLVVINEFGECENFEEGVSDYYKEEISYVDKKSK